MLQWVVEKKFESQNCGTLLLSMTKSNYGTCHGIYDLQYEIIPAWVRPSLADVSTKCFTHGTTLPPMVDGDENTRWGCCYADLGLSSADVQIVVPGSQTAALKVKFHCTSSWTLKCATTGAVLTSGSGPDTGYSASDGCYNGWVEKKFESQNCGTLLLSMTKSRYGTCHGIYDLQYQIVAPTPRRLEEANLDPFPGAFV